NVKLTILICAFIERRCTSDNQSCQFVSTIGLSIAHSKVARPARNKRPGSTLACFTRTKHKDFANAELAKNFLGKVNRHGAHRYRAARNFSARANLLRNPKGTLEQAVKIRPDRS